MLYLQFNGPLTLSVPEKLKKQIFEILTISQILNINSLRATSTKSISLHTIRKLVEYYLKNVTVKAMLFLTQKKLEDRSVLSPFQWSAGSKTVKVFQIMLKLLEKWLTYKLRRFWMVFNFHLILFNLFSIGKIEKLDFLDANNSTNFKHQ